MVAEKRRRAQIFDAGTQSRPRNFMKPQLLPAQSATGERREAAAIVMTAFRKFFFIGEDTFDRMPMVLDAIQSRKVAAGELLIKKGEDGDKMYVIMSGVLEVMKDDEETVKIELVHGDLVGEVALVYNEKRMATVRVKESGVLYSLERAKFRELQAMASTASIVKRGTWLHAATTLSAVEYFPLSRLAQTVDHYEVAPGEVLIREGEVTDRCILLESGKVAVDGGEGDEYSCFFPATIELEPAIGKSQSEERPASQTGVDGGDAGAAKVVEAVAGSFFGDGLLRAVAGLPTPWIREGEGAMSPITVVNRSDKSVSCSVFTLQQLKQCLGSDDLKNYIVDETILETRRMNKSSAGKLYTREDFDVLTFLGQGSFGSVKLVKTKAPEADPALPTTYALKALSKVYIVNSGQVDHTLDERAIVLQLNHPNVLRVYTTFQSEDELFILSEYIAGCDLWALIHGDAAKTGEAYGLPPNFVKFYSANIIEALGHIHGQGIAYRDLKPENVMVDDSGYLKVIDFGFAKKIPYTLEVDGNTQFMPKSHTMCGTPEYLSPEFITSEGHDHTADLWSLGVLVHELVTSTSPFSDGTSNMTQLFTNIVTTLYTGVKISPEFDEKAGGPGISDLIRGLCAFKSTDRLGGKAQGMDEVKQLDLFQDFDFDKLKARELDAPWKPSPDELAALREEEEDRVVEKFTGDQTLFEVFSA